MSDEIQIGQRDEWGNIRHPEPHDYKTCKTCRTINPEEWGPAELYLDCGHIKRATHAQLDGAREWCSSCDEFAFVVLPEPRVLTEEDVQAMHAEDRRLGR